MTPYAEMSGSPWRHVADSNPFLESSSPELTPSQPTEIFMMSPPECLDDSADDYLVFLTPPEHQRRMSSSSDDDLLLGLKKARVLEDEPAIKRSRVSGPKLVDDSGSDMCAVSLADDAPEVTVDCVQKASSIDEVVKAETSKEKGIAEKCDGNSFTSRSSDIDHNIEDANVELRCVISDSGIDESEQEHMRCVGNVEVVAKAGVDDGKIVSSDAKRSQDTDRLVRACKKFIGGTSNVAERASELVNKENGRGGSGVGAVGRENELRQFLDALKVIVSSLNTLGDGEVEFLETARKRGMAFPRPRAWSLVDDES